MRMAGGRSDLDRAGHAQEKQRRKFTDSIETRTPR
jgi:hypothetical protein